eukprot:TRINITY_DN6785_c0_g1_i1.p2 TRINITY_DN6785_c0_g1~~TRINITY_DN6785_c0_g1_i1.p2  ORF type:complete len:141 (+),score=57.79 TRINITY_DN6785_c0_g1_i1:76-498(+)
MPQLGQAHFLYGGCFGMANLLLQLFSGQYSQGVFILGVMLHFFANLVFIAGSMLMWEQWSILRVKNQGIKDSPDLPLFAAAIFGGLVCEFAGIYLMQASLSYGAVMIAVYCVGLALLDSQFNGPIRSLFGSKKAADTWST